MEKTDLFLMYNMAAAVILCYILSAMCWFYIFRINVRFKSAFPTACLCMSILWLYYGYKNYDFYFIQLHKMNYPDMWKNLGGVIVLAVLSFIMCMASTRILNQAVSGKK